MGVNSPPKTTSSDCALASSRPECAFHPRSLIHPQGMYIYFSPSFPGVATRFKSQISFSFAYYMNIFQNFAFCSPDVIVLLSANLWIYWSFFFFSVFNFNM